MLSSNLKALDFRPQDGPLDESCAAKPADDLIAKIDKAVDAKPTATVIAPNYIVTAGHWTGLINLHVDIEVDGQIQTYKTVDGDRIDTATRDLGVYRIERCIGTGQEPCDVTEDANLEQWIDFYFAEDQVGKEFVIGSYGPQPQAGLGPGTLHWGANMVTIIEMGNPFIRFVFEETTDDDYVKYEAEGVDKDSGSGWFVRLGPEWKQAALGQTSHAGHRFSWYTAPIELYTLIDWVDDMICSLNAARPPGDQEADPRPRYDPTDTAWEGGVSSAWGTLGNWSDGVPTSSDIVRVDSIVTAVISSETAEAKELAVGYGYGYDPSVDDDCDDLTDPVPPAVT
jgi:hypothetical protein